MSTSLLHYREWHGSFRRPLWAVRPIMRVALGMVFRRRLFWILYSVGLLLFLMFFFGYFLLDWLETQIPAGPLRWGSFRADPDRILTLIRQGLLILNGSQYTFAYYFSFQGTMVMVVLAMAGSVLVGNDFTNRSLDFYLSKPVSRWHYIAGKCLAVSVLVNMLTTGPALILFVQRGFSDWDYFVNPDYFLTSTGRSPGGLALLGGILGFGILISFFMSLLLVATASWMRRTIPLIMVWTTLFLFFKLLAVILVDGLKYGGTWRVIDLWNDLCLVGFALLGFEEKQIWPAPQPDVAEAVIVLVGVTILCLIYLSLRTQAAKT